MGNCAISGGPFFYDGMYNVVEGVDKLIPVDVYCPRLPAKARGAPGSPVPAPEEDQRQALVVAMSATFPPGSPHLSPLLKTRSRRA
jgi:Ni,Fe-hydrogenase III small subunit